MPSRALLEHRLGAAVGGVIGVLHARDLGGLQRAEQVRQGDVTQADRPDQAVIAGRGHCGELVVEQRVRS
jgi:hypothetical protein